MHHIQKQILQQLVYKPKLRFAQLKPVGIESNHFMYHLHCLMNDDMVVKKDNFYVLSANGKAYADRLSLKNFKPRIQPKIVTLISVRNQNGEYLLYRRKHQPFIGLVGFPYGKVHLEEHLAESATRELAEKTGLKAVLQHRGDVYLTVFEDNSLLSHMLCHVFWGSKVKGELQNRSQKGVSFWAKLNQFEKSEFMPGFLDIEKCLRSRRGLFFKEFEYRL